MTHEEANEIADDLVYERAARQRRYTAGGYALAEIKAREYDSKWIAWMYLFFLPNSEVSQTSSLPLSAGVVAYCPNCGTNFVARP